MLVVGEMEQGEPRQFSQWKWWSCVAACHPFLEGSTPFLPAESGDVLRGDFGESSSLLAFASSSLDLSGLACSVRDV